MPELTPTHWAFAIAAAFALGVGKAGFAGLSIVHVLVFAFLGCIVAVTVASRVLYSATAVALLGAVTWWALVWDGFDLAYVHWGALVTAYVSYAAVVRAGRAIWQGAVSPAAQPTKAESVAG